jgi:hypothetical protein
MVERADIERFRLANSELSKGVQAALEDFFLSLDLSKPELVRDALLEFMPILTDQYGSVAATMAADWYDELRAGSRASGRFRALAAPSVPTEAVEEKVRYLASHLWTPDPAGMLGALLTAADKYVKQPGRDTMASNARREGARFARVPTGKKTCSFCLILASRDAVYSTKQAAGDRRNTGKGDSFHGKCDCQVVRIGKESDYPKDYLPDNYFDMYSAATKDNSPEVRAFLASLEPDDKNKQIKAAAFSLRRNFPDAIKDSVHTH